MPHAEEQTTLIGATQASDVQSADSVPGLTILYHPVLDRIGERAWFADVRPGKRWQLSRNQLDFTGSGGQHAGPLNTRKISRKPIAFCAEPDHGIAIHSDPTNVKVKADGQSMPAVAHVSLERLVRGVVLVINNAVALLLHYPTRIAPVADTMPALVGQSRGIHNLRQQIAAIAPRDVPVLLRGESGTGKELVARAIHAHSRRAEHPMISVNMAAVPGELAASELFGHDAGAFSGARKPRTGVFVAADGGTLFLDEIGHSPASVQLALLRALETGLITPLGRSHSIQTDVRVVAATDRNLTAAIEEGAFHAALLERLGGIELYVPPLRDRREDIAILLFRFVRELLPADRRDALLGDPEDPWLRAKLIAALVRYHWPRNVRQLRNVAQELALLSASRPFRPGPKVQQILSELDPTSPPADPASPGAPSPARPTLARPAPDSDAGPRAADTPAAYTSPHDITRDELRRILRANNHVIHRAAKALNVSQQSMYRLLDSHEILYAKKIPREMFIEYSQATGGDIREMARRLEVSERALRLRKKALGL